jgi:hypothetical protein
MTVKWVVALVCMAALTGCNHRLARPVRAAECQRFLPIPADSVMTQGVPWHGFLALDTRTGDLCRTVSYDIIPKGSADDLSHSLLRCSDILRAEKEAAHSN